MKWALLALKYLPHVLSAVTAVEQTLGAGKGESKKKVIMDAIQAGAKVAGGVDEDHVAAIGVLVDRVVGSLNDSGLLDGKPRSGQTSPSK